MLVIPMLVSAFFVPVAGQPTSEQKALPVTVRSVEECRELAACSYLAFCRYIDLLKRERNLTALRELSEANFQNGAYAATA